MRIWACFVSFGIGKHPEDRSGQLHIFGRTSRGAQCALDQRSEVTGQGQRLLGVIDRGDLCAQISTVGQHMIQPVGEH